MTFLHYMIIQSLKTRNHKNYGKNWYISDSNPTKTTNFILVWEKPWSKLQKSQELWIEVIYWRDNITKQFPYLLDIKAQENKKEPIQMWLF